MGASGQVNWRIPRDFTDWTMGMEKRLMHEERRKPAPLDGHTYVPGLGVTSVRIFDWNDIAATTNGFYYSEPGAINSPDVANNSFFIGTVQQDDDFSGIQHATTYRPNPPAPPDGNFKQVSYGRRFWEASTEVEDGIITDDPKIKFEPWQPLAPVLPVTDDQTRAASGAFAGSVQFRRVDNLVTCYGQITRASGFNTAYVGTGVNIPPGMIPSAVRPFSAAPIWGTASDQYQFRVTTGTVVEVRQSAATSSDLICQGSYFL